MGRGGALWDAVAHQVADRIQLTVFNADWYRGTVVHVDTIVGNIFVRSRRSTVDSAYLCVLLRHYPTTVVVRHAAQCGVPVHRFMHSPVGEAVCNDASGCQWRHIYRLCADSDGTPLRTSCHHADVAPPPAVDAVFAVCDLVQDTLTLLRHVGGDAVATLQTLQQYSTAIHDDTVLQKRWHHYVEVN
uniref:Auxin response factor 1 n=1 Tax=Lygus hesperus TaxID=30085 RepID=A0A0A9WJU4_LYGHE